MSKYVKFGNLCSKQVRFDEMNNYNFDDLRFFTCIFVYFKKKKKNDLSSIILIRYSHVRIVLTSETG